MPPRASKPPKHSPPKPGPSEDAAPTAAALTTDIMRATTSPVPTRDANQTAVQSAMQAPLEGTSTAASTNQDTQQNTPPPPPPSPTVASDGPSTPRIGNAIDGELADAHVSTPTSARATNQTTTAATRSQFVTMGQLKPSLTDWILLAKVVSCGSVRQWSSFSANGTLLEIFLVDPVGGFVRATVFNEAISRFEAVLRPGSCCSFTGGQIKYKMSVGRVSADHDLTFGNKATILACDDDFPASMAQPCTPVANIVALKDKTSVHVFGILAQCGPIKTFVSSAKKPLVKRELLIVDETRAKVVCTVWSATARDSLDADEGKPCLVVNARVSVFNNFRSVSAGADSSFLVDPHLPRANELRSWYDAGVDFATFTGLGAA